MPIDILMPALSPTMEAGTLARWLVKEGDAVKSGQVLAEIETDKATMEFEAADEGRMGSILVPEGSEEVKVGTLIAVLLEEGEEAGTVAAPSPNPLPPGERAQELAPAAPFPSPSPSPLGGEGRGEGATPSQSTRLKASPLARRMAEQAGIDLAAITGSGPGGRIVKADLSAAAPAPQAAPLPAQAPAPAPAPVAIDTDIPHSSAKLSNMRKVIARRLTEAKQQVPHIYLTVDIRLDALLKLRGELNAALTSHGIKLSVNDLLIKALAKALMQVPACNVSFAGDQLISYTRADISVAVSIPGGLITPIVKGADSKAVSAISAEMAALAARAKEGKLQPHEYQGGTASLSNMGMYGIKQFDAVINPPQGMIMAIGAGEKRPAVIDDALAIATIMSATGSFDHRAIDGADGAQLMQAFKALVETPLALVV